MIAQAVPATAWEWFKINATIGATSFGSGGRALLYQNEVVERRRWMSEEEFHEILSLTQILPGPNLASLAVYLGYRLIGLPGSVLGLMALALPGALLLVLASTLLGQAETPLAPFFRGVSISSIALFLVLIRKSANGLFQSADAAAPVAFGKKTARFALAAAVPAALFLKLPVPLILASGAGAGLLIEFMSWR